MRILAPLLGLLLSSPVQATSSLEVLESYRELCADLKSYHMVQDRAESVGWKIFVPAANTPEAEYSEPKNRGFRNVLAKRAYRRAVNGHEAYLFLMLARESDGIGSGVHCAIHYPTIDVLPSPANVAAFMGLSTERVEIAFSSDRDEQGYAFFPGVGSSNEQTNINVFGKGSLFASEGTGLHIWSIDKQGSF